MKIKYDMACNNINPTASSAGTRFIAAAALLLAIAAAVSCGNPRRTPVVGLAGSCSERTVSSPRSYMEALMNVGAMPFVLPVAKDSVAADKIVSMLDAIVFTGGEDVNPAYYGEGIDGTEDINYQRDSSEMLLVRAAVRAGIPILGICRGEQVVNVALGGSLVQDIPTQVDSALSHREPDRFRERVHTVDFEPGSYIAGIFGKDTLGVNSSHHQSVKTAGRGLRITGRTSDGVVEAYEGLPELNIVCVQFHPEAFARYGDETFLKIFQDLLDRAR